MVEIFSQEPGQDSTLLRIWEAFQYSQDLQLEWFWFIPDKDRVTGGAHSRLDLFNRKELILVSELLFLFQTSLPKDREGRSRQESDKQR